MRQVHSLSFYKYLFMCFFCTKSTFTFAQSVLMCGGGNASTADHTFSYTIGEVFVAAEENETYIPIQTVQIPFEIYQLNSVFQSKQISLKLYPNPADDFIQIYSEEINSNLNVVIYNSVGTKLYEKEYFNGLFEIDVRNLCSGLYYLQLKSPNTPLTLLNFIKS